MYFWESDHRRAEKWAIRNVREMILECQLETELLIDLLIDDQRSPRESISAAPFEDYESRSLD